MGRNKKSNKNVKGHIITIRCTEDEYKHCERQAKKAGMDNRSDYVRSILFCGNRSLQHHAAFVVSAQELLNYVTGSYTADETLEKMVDRLWDMITG